MTGPGRSGGDGDGGEGTRVYTCLSYSVSEPHVRGGGGQRGGSRTAVAKHSASSNSSNTWCRTANDEGPRHPLIHREAC